MLLPKLSYLAATNMSCSDKTWPLNICQELMGLLILSCKSLETFTCYNTQVSRTQRDKLKRIKTIWRVFRFSLVANPLSYQGLISQSYLHYGHGQIAIATSIEFKWTVLEYVRKPIKRRSFVCHVWQAKSDKRKWVTFEHKNVTCLWMPLQRGILMPIQWKPSLLLLSRGCLSTFALFLCQFSIKSGFTSRRNDLWPACNVLRQTGFLIRCL